MADPPESGTAARDTASEGLSQLGARILNQLAISAWLPSAALVLLLAFVTQLGQVVENDDSGGWFDASMQAFGRLADMSAGAFFLLAAAVVVLTLLTQAFTFEAIRLLEGYWGTRGVAARVAARMCRRHRRRRDRLRKRQLELTRAAWDLAELAIRDEEHEDGDLDEDMIVSLRRRLRQDGRSLRLPQHKEQVVQKYNWQVHADPELIRQRTNLIKQLRDYPQSNHLMSTRLGNVLRRAEEATDSDEVESFVEERFDALPFSLRVSHDEVRGRLDMYASMTLVWLFVGVVATVRFVIEVEDGDWRLGDRWEYGVALLGVCVVGAWFTCRAAVSSARYYGSLLRQIAKYPVIAPAMAGNSAASGSPAADPGPTQPSSGRDPEPVSSPSMVVEGPAEPRPATGESDRPS
jgi:hypothetical protein